MTQLSEAYAHHMNQHSPEGIYEPTEKKIIVRDSLFEFKIDHKLSDLEKAQGIREVELKGKLPPVPAFALLKGIEFSLPEAERHPLKFEGNLDIEEEILAYGAEKHGEDRIRPTNSNSRYGCFTIGAMAFERFLRDHSPPNPSKVYGPVYRVYFVRAGSKYVNTMEFKYIGDSPSLNPPFVGFEIEHRKKGTRDKMLTHVRNINLAINLTEKVEDVVASARK
jgi:hypothetical protein